MVLPDVHPQVALLLGPVRALRTLEHRLLSAALDLLVPPQRRLPPVPLAAVPAGELRLAAVAGPHDLPGDHPELPHRTGAAASGAPGAHLLDGVAQQPPKGGVRLRTEDVLQLQVFGVLWKKKMRSV